MCPHAGIELAIVGALILDTNAVFLVSQNYPKVVDLMRGNVEKVLERDAKLTDLEDKSGVLVCHFILSNVLALTVPIFSKDALKDGASRFQTTSRKLKRKMWWKNIKVCRSPKQRKSVNVHLVL